MYKAHGEVKNSAIVHDFSIGTPKVTQLRQIQSETQTARKHESTRLRRHLARSFQNTLIVATDQPTKSGRTAGKTKIPASSPNTAAESVEKPRCTRLAPCTRLTILSPTLEVVGEAVSLGFCLQ
jgi:hypothetical protein